MTHAYESQLKQQLRAAEDELGRLRRERADLIQRTQLAEAALAVLHECEEPYDDERAVPTPGQWITLWNRATPAERLDTAAHILNSNDRAYTCTMGRHVARIEQLKQRAVHAEARIAELTAGLQPTEDALTRVLHLAEQLPVAYAGRISAAIDGRPDPAADCPTPIECDHRDPNQLGARPSDLALVCQCGTQIGPAIRPAKPTEARP